MPDLIRSRPTPWHTVVLLCGKCSRKMKGGYGDEGEDTLRTVLRAEIKAQTGGRGVRVIETRCLGVCPKKAVVALNATRPDRLLTVPKGTSAEQALAALVPELPPARS